MEAGEQSKKFIILVEDEQIIANLIVAELEKAGYAVKLAREGREGLELIHSTKPDLVLLDVMLPGLNGFQILEQLSKEGRLPSLPVIIISNSGQPVEIERGLRLGVRDYLIKVDFSPQELREKVQHFFASPPSSHDKQDMPLLPMSASEQDTSAKEKEYKKGRSNVLIIEDDIIISESLERKFTEHSYNSYRAINIGDARNILNEHSIDIILLDIVLPDIDGLSFLSELKADERFKNIPVIIVSNLGQREEIERGMRGGAADYVIKANVLPGEIFKKVESFLSHKLT